MGIVHAETVGYRDGTYLAYVARGAEHAIGDGADWSDATGAADSAGARLGRLFVGQAAVAHDRRDGRGRHGGSLGRQRSRGHGRGRGGRRRRALGRGRGERAPESVVPTAVDDAAGDGAELAAQAGAAEKDLGAPAHGASTHPTGQRPLDLTAVTLGSAPATRLGRDAAAVQQPAIGAGLDPANANAVVALPGAGAVYIIAEVVRYQRTSEAINCKRTGAEWPARKC